MPNRWRNLYADAYEFWLALALVARAPRPVAAGLGWGSGHHAALRELPGIGPYPTEPRDGAAPGCGSRMRYCWRPGSHQLGGKATSLPLNWQRSHARSTTC